MIGLPARGKTYMSKKLTRYLNWIGVPTKGQYRLKSFMRAMNFDLSTGNTANMKQVKKLNCLCEPCEISERLLNESILLF